MKLLIAIPALNEEDSIESTIVRCLDARGRIQANSPIEEVEIAVVSDGSTDRTVELASRYAGQIKIIVFPVNRGYGAAIKEAWRQSDADVLGFLDADGTCDPECFAPLCRTLCEQGADIALGCRLNAGSKMPLVRRIGNRLFAWILHGLSSKRVHDTASGMRVVRRSSLPKLFPLPDGLHFTPAMSARALLDKDLSIVEIDMPYQERAGESKLRIGKDGLRFLRVILDAAFLYRPSRPLRILGLACLAIAMGLMVMPTLYYLQHRSVLEWMLYRFVVSQLVGTAAVLFFAASYITRKVLRITLKRQSGRDPVERVLEHPWFWAIPIGSMAAGTALVIPSFLQVVRTGATYEHWSRFIVMSFLFAVAQILAITWVIDYCLKLLSERLAYLESGPAAKPAPAEEDRS
ncbi:MAG: glycosyltransferase family 2 protein [Bryobacteraceae bacterium]